MRQQRLAALRLPDLVRPGQQGIEITELLDELRRRLHADARHPRHVVDRVAGQRLDFDHLLRADTELLLHLLRPDRLAVHRIEHLDAGADKLHQILVGGDDRHLRSCLAGQPRVSRDEVVRLPAFQLDAGDVEGAHRLADQRKLRQQFVRRIGPVRLVLGVEIVAKGALGGIEDHRDVVGVSVVQQLQQHVGEAEDGVDGRAVRPGERRQLMEGAEDEARAVDQVDVPGLRRWQLGGGLAQYLHSKLIALSMRPGRLRPGDQAEYPFSRMDARITSDQVPAIHALPLRHRGN